VAQKGGGVEVWPYSSKTSALEGGKWSAARPGRTLPRERPGTHCTGGWVGPRAGLEGRKISAPPGFDPRTVQPVVSRYTGWATRPTVVCINKITGEWELKPCFRWLDGWMNGQVAGLSVLIPQVRVWNSHDTENNRSCLYLVLTTNIRRSKWLRHY
jgi:hypothetical protein